MRRGGIQTERELVAAAVAQGFRRRDTRKGVMLLAPDGVNSVTVHLTTSDHRALKNAVSHLRRYGFDPEKAA